MLLSNLSFVKALSLLLNHTSILLFAKKKSSKFASFVSSFNLAYLE
ncbi:hypothetical protein FMM58_05780 [Campylobacter sp. LR291e]|nr:hypothetical protein FMM55_04150 [Campylobacter sp. LR196d]KAA6228692.1 hypothetical protein FMM54_00345 [Campylobacter sp. LR185c]KAA6229095.1 hypothetical protein FMM57_01525 [Campylobacter sp. LR286c]KAA6230340.1 hypothetical protein FMM58_05780 [Campylobacter sp. LR291e]KAA6233895.1 hypothetical protein FMM56_01995 [Campylobacter sp. LR264d]